MKNNYFINFLKNYNWYTNCDSKMDFYCLRRICIYHGIFKNKLGDLWSPPIQFPCTIIVDNGNLFWDNDPVLPKDMVYVDINKIVFHSCLESFLEILKNHPSYVKCHNSTEFEFVEKYFNCINVQIKVPDEIVSYPFYIEYVPEHYTKAIYRDANCYIENESYFNIGCFIGKF